MSPPPPRARRLPRLEAVCEELGLQAVRSRAWSGQGRRIDATGAYLRLSWPVSGGPEHPLSFRPRMPSARGIPTGDLAFDGRFSTRGPEAAVRSWLGASARRTVETLLHGGLLLRVTSERLALVRPKRWRPALFRTLELLSHPDWNVASDPSRDADPRVRALAALHVIRARGTAGERLEELATSSILPRWVRQEAAMTLFRDAPTPRLRARWSDLIDALDLNPTQDLAGAVSKPRDEPGWLSQNPAEDSEDR